VHALRATSFQSTPNDRAVARKLVHHHGWYTDVLARDQAALDEILVLIFWHAVIPDLADPAVADEISRWAGQQNAPESVIRALFAASAGRAESPKLMTQALAPGLARRWRIEHGISIPREPPASIRNAAPSPREASYSPPGSSVLSEQPTAASHALTLPDLLSRTVTIPVPIALAVLVALVVLLLVALS